MSIQDVYNIGVYEFLNYAAFCKSNINNENKKVLKANNSITKR